MAMALRRRAQPRTNRYRAATQQRSTRQQAPVASYRELSTDESDAEDEDTGQDDVHSDPEYPSPQIQPSSNKRKRAIEHSQSSKFKDCSNEYTPKKRTVATKPPSTALPTEATPSSQSYNRKVPDWTSLPYDILCQIFDYAAFPLCNERLQPYYFSGQHSTLQWLINTSRICRKFAEPGMSVLYRCPPMAPMSRSHGLVQQLKSNQNTMTMNYRNKIESIQFEVTLTAAYSYAGQGTLDLYGLIRNAPRLKDLEIYHEKDMSPYRDLGVPIKWSYPDALFEALAERWNEEVEEHDWKTGMMVTETREHGPVKLRSWRWSSRLASEKQSLENLIGIHLTASFHDLKKIAFVNYQMPKLRKGQADPDHEAKLAEAINILPCLKHLIFESCTLVNSKLLPLLPGTLQVLEVINCSELDAEDLAAFLISKGGHLRELILNHNCSLSLSFMPILASACPRLEILRMNFNYYNTTSTSWESEPNYDKILHIQEVPTWPSSLRIIDLHQLRQWDVDTAEMFFMSLVNSSAQLSHLRQLTIKAILAIGWKVRAEFRTKWINIMENVFLSRRPDPNPAWTSIEAYRSQKEAGTPVGEEQLEVADDDDDDDILIRRPRLRKRQSSITYIEPETSDESDVELISITRSDNTDVSRRTRQVQRGELPSPPCSRFSNNQPGNSRRSDRVALKMARMGAEITNFAAETCRRTTRSTRSLALPSSPPASDSDSDGEPLLQKKSALNVDSDDEPLSNRKSKGKAVQSINVPYVQGMCDFVKIFCDNIRPREELLTEGDFLDSEPDDDSDWNGDDAIPGDEEIVF